MKKSYSTHYCRVEDSVSLKSRLPSVATMLDDMVTDLCQILALEHPEIESIPVIVLEHGISEVPETGTIIIVPREDARCGLREWCEMLFRHEVTHWLVHRAWGSSIVMFWEGLPVYLADNVIRERVFHFSYHAYCAALFHNHALLGLASGLLPHQYYGMSHDFRITAEYGSFTGYLVEQYGIQSIQQAYHHYVPPTPERPILELSRLFQATWGKDLDILEAAWRDFLTELNHTSPEAEALVTKQQYSDHVELKDRHCRFCCTPCDNRAECPICQASQDIEITVI